MSETTVNAGNVSICAGRGIPSFELRVNNIRTRREERFPMSRDFDAKKVPKNRPVDSALDGWDPINEELGGFHPSESAEFLPIDANPLDAALAHRCQKIRLLLAVAPFFSKARAELVAIRSALVGHRVITRLKPDFFTDLAAKCLQVGLSVQTAPLRKLPRTAEIDPLTHKHIPAGSGKDERDISSITHPPMILKTMTMANWKLAQGSHRQLKSSSVIARILVLLTALAGFAFAQQQTPSPAPPPDRPGFWRAELEGGTYTVALGSIASVSIHEYLVEQAARVTEVVIDTMGSVQARFYFIEPNLPDAPGGVGQSAIDLVKDRTAMALDRTGTDAWKKVVKSYPAATHAHTVEYRLGSKETLQRLFRDVEACWMNGRGHTFKP